MCIRDSRSLPIGEQAWAKARRCGPRAVYVRLEAYVRFGIPVSYTHLRAHETVLDLVCRLLLEKKNDHIHSHALQYDDRPYRTTRTNYMTVYWSALQRSSTPLRS